MDELGKRLKEHRKKDGLTLAEVKEKSDLSISYLSDLERGRTNPSLDTLKQLAGIYKTTVSELMEETESNRSSEELEEVKEKHRLLDELFKQQESMYEKELGRLRIENMMFKQELSRVRDDALKWDGISIAYRIEKVLRGEEI